MQFFWILIAVLAAGLLLLIANHDSGQVFGIENDAFASLLHMSLWLSVLVVGLVFSVRRRSAAMRNFAFWLIILLVLTTGYQYRYELQDMASRLTAGLVPGSPMTISSATGGQAVMLDKSSNGHFEVRMQVNGTTVRALVDTGASATVLSAADARRVGIAVEDLRFSVPVMTANGRAHAARARVDTLAIGPIERTQVPVLVAEPGRLEQTLLGMQFLSSLSGFEMRGDRLILRD
ncbi:TIGR02281 family clan AA aspartic protease [Chelativorans intermedius]|uniref:TIGR02281 family clan AA aspartic protease n=1 Tax=Chelativorans intermedius TaxID=515947 RepID=A0ABV6DAF0_9HYPH|nr:TIGR02281 family clan AA aspartic protease [Chelativorans intermedius]MCT9000112.1 TIGR02281 family clan AA aspartic protease [Chelativorans intermedius]